MSRVDITKLLEMAEDMKGQDNRMTSHPIFMVEERARTGSRYVAVQPFFSNKAAEQYIKDNARNLRDPHVYVKSGQWNDEWQAVRRVLQQMNGEVE